MHVYIRMCMCEFCVRMISKESQLRLFCYYAMCVKIQHQYHLSVTRCLELLTFFLFLSLSLLSLYTRILSFLPFSRNVQFGFRFYLIPVICSHSLRVCICVWCRKKVRGFRATSDDDALSECSECVDGVWSLAVRRWWWSNPVKPWPRFAFSLSLSLSLSLSTC